MTPYYDEGGITIYNGDCREIDAWLEADVLITDPPYGIGGDLSMSGFASRDRFGIQAWDTTLEARDAALSMWGDRPSAVFGSPRMLDSAPPHRQAPLIWDKGDMVAMGDCAFPWRLTYELIYVNGEGWAGHRGESVIRVAHNSTIASKIGHPSTKPVGLMSLLIQKSTGVVADPFCGSGSTLVAAKRLGRGAIGVELDERYCEIAARRLGQGVLNFDAPADIEDVVGL